MSNPWQRIEVLLGPGYHWGRSREELLYAIEKATYDGDHDAADHLRIILDRRDEVQCHVKETQPKLG